MINRLTASCLGIGYIKGGGTIAAGITCLIIYLLQKYQLLGGNITLIITAVVITLIGIYTGNKVEPLWGKDSYRVVIDEVAGMLVTLLFTKLTVLTLISGFVLFRFFDMVKPLYIKRMEKLPGGTGVMMDDILAGVYANLVLHVVIILSNYYL